MENNLITKFVIENLPKLPEGEVEFELFFKYNRDGFVETSAKVIKPKGVRLTGNAYCSFSYRGGKTFEDHSTNSCRCEYN